LAAIKAGKEKKAEAASVKKAEKAKNAGAASKGQGGKIVGKQAAKGSKAKPQPSTR